MQEIVGIGAIVFAALALITAFILFIGDIIDCFKDE